MGGCFPPFFTDFCFSFLVFLGRSLLVADGRLVSPFTIVGLFLRPRHRAKKVFKGGGSSGLLTTWYFASVLRYYCESRECLELQTIILKTGAGNRKKRMNIFSRK